ncbi:MAG: mandelate racemase/muconate lactonizing enzyme family protein [Pseudomonadota bacterium]
MKITALETLRLEEFPNLVWVIVEDSEGGRGTGESFFGAGATEAYLHEIASPLLLGQDPRDREAIRRRLAPYTGYNGAGAEVRGASAVDMALWDLWGRHLDQPVWRLLGGRCRERIRTYNTCAGYRYVRGSAEQTTQNWGLGAAEGPYEDLDGFLSDAGKVAESLLSQRITGMKIWPFDFAAEASLGAAITPDQLAEAVEPFAKIRAAVGGQMQIMAEMHLLWQPHAMAEIARALEPFDIYWIEDPMPATAPTSWADLRAQVRPKIAGSETMATRAAFRSFMAAGALDVVIMDLGWCGGLTEANAIASMAEAFHLPIAPHDCTGPLAWAACTHLTLNAPNALVQESVRAFYTGWYGELAQNLPVVEDGHIHLPEGAGMITELKPEVFARPDAHLRRSAL